MDLKTFEDRERLRQFFGMFEELDFETVETAYEICQERVRKLEDEQLDRALRDGILHYRWLSPAFDQAVMVPEYVESLNGYSIPDRNWYVLEDSGEWQLSYYADDVDALGDPNCGTLTSNFETYPSLVDACRLAESRLGE